MSLSVAENNLEILLINYPFIRKIGLDARREFSFLDVIYESGRCEIFNSVEEAESRLKRLEILKRKFVLRFEKPFCFTSKNTPEMIYLALPKINTNDITIKLYDGNKKVYEHNTNIKETKDE